MLRALKYNICPIVCTTTEKSDDIIFQKPGNSVSVGVKVKRGPGVVIFLPGRPNFHQPAPAWPAGISQAMVKSRALNDANIYSGTVRPTVPCTVGQLYQKC